MRLQGHSDDLFFCYNTKDTCFCVKNVIKFGVGLSPRFLDGL